MRRTLALLACLALGVSAQTVDPKKLCTIEGRTYNARTGEPVPRVTLTLAGSGPNVSPRAGRSDNEGRFLIENVPAGSYRLTAERVGFLRQGYGSRTPAGPAAPLNLSEGQSLKNLELRLTPQGVILGLITDEDGDPVPRASVRAWPQGSPASQTGPAGGMRAGARQTMSGTSSMTNDIGEYRLAGLSPGSYIVVVERMGAAMGRGGPGRGGASAQDEAPVPTYYPSTVEASNAVPIEIIPGQEAAGINITMRSGSLFRIQGRVMGTMPQDAAGISLSLMPRAGLVMPMARGGATAKPDGSFELTRVAPGSYYVVAQTGGRQGGRGLAGKTMVEVTTADITGLIVPLATLLTASGTVKIDGQQSADLQRVNLMLTPLDGTISGGVSSGRVSADGTFKLANVFPDRYYLNAFGLPDGAYLKSVRLANQDVLERGIDLSSFRTSAVFDVILSLKAATLQGTVTAGDKPGIGSTIAVLPDPLRPGQPYLNKSATADQEGRFTIRGLAPGAYKVYAFEDPMSGLTQDPGLAAPYEHRAVKVDLDESASEQVELKALTAGDARR